MQLNLSKLPDATNLKEVLLRRGLTEVMKSYSILAANTRTPSRPTVMSPAGEDAVERAKYEHYVKLRQAAAIVNKSKETLEPLVGNVLPEPDIRAAKGSGKAHEWKWSSIRPALMRHFNRELPEVFPTDTLLRKQMPKAR